MKNALSNAQLGRWTWMEAAVLIAMLLSWLGVTGLSLVPR